MMKLVVITVLACLFASSNVEAIQVCGKRLAETLSMVCEGQYFQPQQRRSVQQSLPAAVGSVSNWIMSTRGTERLTRGIVDECCRQACDYETLLTYCAA